MIDVGETLSLALRKYCDTKENLFVPIYDNVTSLGIIMVYQPHIHLSSQQINRLFSLTHPYTARAFHEDINSMKTENVQDNFEHTLIGDRVFFLGIIEFLEFSQSSFDNQTDTGAGQI